MTRAGCSVASCEREHCARGLCGRHYTRWLRARLSPPCAVPGCRRGAFARGRCNRHYVQQWRAQRADRADVDPAGAATDTTTHDGEKGVARRA